MKKTEDLSKSVVDSIDKDLVQLEQAMKMVPPPGEASTLVGGGDFEEGSIGYNLQNSATVDDIRSAKNSTIRRIGSQSNAADILENLDQSKQEALRERLNAIYGE